MPAIGTGTGLAEGRGSAKVRKARTPKSALTPFELRVLTANPRRRPPRPSTGPTLGIPGPEIPAPTIETILAAGKGNQAARHHIRLFAMNQALKHQNATQLQALQDQSLFGGAAPDVYRASNPRLMALHSVVASLNPITTAEDALRQGQRGNYGMAGLDIASIVPIGRLARAGKGAVVGVRAAREARAVEEAGQMLRAGKAVPREALRTVQLGEHVQQFPASQARVTRVAQKGLDKISVGLTPKANQLRASDNAITRHLARPLMTSSATGRVSKQAGKALALHEGINAAALHSEASTINAIARRLGRPSAKNMAHYYYAQLPASHRNAEGLSLIRSGLEKQLQDHGSGAFGQRVDELLRGNATRLKTAQKSGDIREIHAALSEKKQYDALKADIPARMRDITARMKQLDKLIAKPPAFDPNIHSALQALSNDREQLLYNADQLHPGDAARRRGLVARAHGLTPDGSEVYMGHRAGKARGGWSNIPNAPSLGKTKAPMGVGQHNHLHLFGTGRDRPSLRVALEDWHSARRYQFLNIAKHELSSMGSPVFDRPGPTMALVNPKGHEIPRTWRQFDIAQRGADSGIPLDPKQLERDIEEYIQNTIARTPEEISKLYANAELHGHLQDLRQVPLDVVKRYFGAFQNPRTTNEVVRGIGTAFNVPNEIARASLLWANLPGYITANSGQNAVMAVAHQGPQLLFNFPRALEILTTGPKDVRAMMLAATGSGATKALGESSIAAKGANVIGMITDEPWRLSALIHEMARMKVLPKSLPHMRAKDYEAARTFLKHPDFKAKLFDAVDRGNQSQVDFKRLGPYERAYLSKVFFIYNWLRSGSRYPFRFAADHPVRTAAIGYTAAGAPGAPAGVQDAIQRHMPTVAGGMPPYLEGALNAGSLPFFSGHQTVSGRTFPTVFPTRQLSPVSTPWDLIQTARDAPGAQTIGQMFNPLITDSYQILNKQSPYGQHVNSYLDAAKQSGQRMLPEAGLIGDLLHPPHDPNKIYPGDSTRLGRLERASRVFPIPINMEAAYRARQRAGEVQPKERIVHKYRLEYQQVAKEAKAVGIGLTPKAKKAWKLRATHDLWLQKAQAKAPKSDLGPTGRLTVKATVRAEIDLLRYLGWIDARQRNYLQTQVKNDPDIDRVKNFHRKLMHDHFGGEGMSSVHKAVKDARKHKELSHG